MKKYQVTIAVLAALAFSGCADPLINPQGSKALSELKQLEESKIQTALIERQTIALERIARHIETTTK